MTQHEQILKTFAEHGNVMTLGQILSYRWGYEARARFTELRRQGYTITCTKGKKPSENTYTLSQPFEVEPSGQLNFLGAA